MNCGQMAYFHGGAEPARVQAFAVFRQRRFRALPGALALRRRAHIGRQTISTRTGISSLVGIASSDGSSI